ncbi:MAG TPA: hypothetical protein VJN01_07835, partial [Xanthomonadales bacterium]|nr:hypothetical protein [Xanthomonadales bacterium]
MQGVQILQTSAATGLARTQLMGKVMAVLLSVASGPVFAFGLTIGPNDIYSLAAGTTDLGCGDLIVEGVLNLDSGTFNNVRAVVIQPGGTVNGGTGTINKSGILTNQGTFNEEDVQVNFIPDCAGAAADSRATFTVQKQFSDLNDNVPVTVHLDCNTGLILDQQKTVMTDNNGQFEVEFVVVDFTQGTLSCEIREEAVPG